MREIKFRAWDKPIRRWYSPVYEAYAGNLEELNIGIGGRLSLRTMTGTADESTFADRFEIVQYTGLKDKNGVEIYEGDVVRRVGGGLLGSPDQVLFTGEVIFTNSGYKAKYFYDEPGSAGKYRHEAQGNLFNESELEVIGNIYENPELLGNINE